MTNTREERVARAIAATIPSKAQPQEGEAWADRNWRLYLPQARAVIALEPSPDVWEAIDRARIALTLIADGKSWSGFTPNAQVPRIREFARVTLEQLPDPPKVTVEEDRA